jgi:hypothetical protein
LTVCGEEMNEFFFARVEKNNDERIAAVEKKIEISLFVLSLNPPTSNPSIHPTRAM